MAYSIANLKAMTTKHLFLDYFEWETHQVNQLDMPNLGARINK
jgi:hypothetical protein